MLHDRKAERQLGIFWEKQFGEIIVPYGFSAQETFPTGIDRMIWNVDGSVVHVQIRHKNSFYWGGIGLCYGYESYRLKKDLETKPTLYVIHDYTRHGKESRVNQIEDWFAEYMEILVACIDLEREGPTWFGDNNEKQIMPICYWSIKKFKPLSQIL